ncbi:MULTISPECIES: SusC/RagA family TonB-linked outer membrane protein [Hydrocarboniphaga]|uniref:SusC/RagA family TonB-linked outer membrane protein n=1 Tax=Hydrocarboniphaga TaxID=243627 RepID=UPI00192A7AE6|nr:MULTISPECIES: SusC/RagA family TonB-linked outer membrane protein [Hydrocarboniphaga]MDZ4079713.1 SusC/RagA family TonB-linked outer membrane protein [Hydrocarboniphaga sp.]
MNTTPLYMLYTLAAACVAGCSVAHAQDDSAAPSTQEVSEDKDASEQGEEPAASTGAIEEIVVTGYSTSAKKDIIGAASVVDIGEIADQPSGNVIRSLQGRLPGVQITTSGNPNAKALIRIRGQGLGPLGFNDPLYVIDGVPTLAGLESLNPNDIDSIQVLRDAATASIYGARAGNGVIVITTKKGAPGMDLSIRANQSIEQFGYNVHPLNTPQRAQAVFNAAINDRTHPNNASSLYLYDWNNDFDNPVLNGVTYGRFTDAAGNRYIDGAMTMQPANTNWFEAVTQQATVRDVNVSLSNAGEGSRFYTSVGYYDARGIVKESGFERISLRLNSDHSLFDDKVTIGENFYINNQRENVVNDLAGQILGLAIEQQSIVPIRTADGKGYGGPTGGVTDRDNPVRIIDQNKDNISRFNKVMGNIFVEYRPIEDLQLRSNLGIDYGRFYFRNYKRAAQAGNLSFLDSLNTSESWQYTLVFSNTGEYKFTLGDDHNFTVLAGTETIDFRSENFFGAVSGFASLNRNFAYLSQGTTNPSVGGGGDSWGLQSYFTKIDYDYDQKYLASVTVRRDGSSRFGSNNRWGNFPSVSAGWRISNEPFFNLDSINDLKFRASWGQNGNQEISTGATSTIFVPRYSTTSLFTNQQDEGTAYDLNGVNSGSLPSGFARVQMGNEDLKWETSTQTNLGLDFSMLDNQFFGSFDWFRKRTDDILTLTKPLAAEGEGALRVVNGGTIENKGFEILLGYNTALEFDRIGRFDVSVSANYSVVTNKVLALPDDVVNSFGGDGQTKTILGRSVNSIFGYYADGLFQNQAEVEAHATQSGAAPGRIRYRDLNGDGVINDKDQDFFGTTDPDSTFGLNFDVKYQNWDFNMFWQGVHGGLVKNYWQGFTDFTSLNAGSNYGYRTLDAWSPSNTGSSVPALTLVDSNNEGRESTYYWEKGTYLKLRNLSVGYSPAGRVLSFFNLKTARVFLQAQNILTVKPSGTLIQDPESPGSSFPVPKRYTFGLEATF